MSAVSTLDLVNEFLDALESRDFEHAGRLLADDGFSYQGPIDQFDDGPAFIADISSIGTILKHIERRRLFVDKNEACAILTYRTTIDELALTRIAHWFSVDAGRIVRIESFFDVRAYARLFDPEP